MIRRKLIVLVTITTIFICIAGGCATANRRSDSQVNAEPYGIWVNSEYDSIKNKASRIIYHKNGIWTAFESKISQKQVWCGTISISDSWFDDDGNSWYEVTYQPAGV
jgi:hypothetical protein